MFALRNIIARSKGDTEIPALFRGVLVDENMEPSLLPGRKRATSNARELVSRPVRRTEQAADILRSVPVAPERSLHMPEAKVPRCATRPLGQGARRRVLRVSTTNTRTIAPARSARLQGTSHSKRTSDNAGSTCEKKVELCGRTCVSKDLKRAAWNSSVGITRDMNCASSGVSRVDRRSALTVVKCNKQPATKNLTHAAGKRELQTTAGGSQPRPPGAKGRTVGATQPEHRVSAGYRVPRGSRAGVLTRGNEQNTRDRARDRPVNCEGTSETKISLRPRASVKEDEGNVQLPRPSSSSGSAAFRGSSGGTGGHPQPESGSPVRPQLYGDACPPAQCPPNQREGDLWLTTKPNHADSPIAHGNCLVRNAEVISTFTSRHCSACEDETDTDVSTVHLPSRHMLDTCNLPLAKIRLPAKRGWCASKPFPKKDAFDMNRSGVRLCSSFPRKGTPTAGVAFDIDQKEPRVMSQAETLAPRHTADATTCNPDVENSSEQQQPSAADATKLTTAKAKLRPQSGRKAQQEKGNLPSGGAPVLRTAAQAVRRGSPALRTAARAAEQGAPVLRTAARAAARTAASRPPPAPTLPACAKRNEGLPRGCPLPHSRITTAATHISLACSPQANPRRPTGFHAKGNPVRCLLGSKGGNFVTKCATLEQCRDLTASTNNYAFSRVVKQKVSATYTSPARAQPLLPKTSLLVKDSYTVSSEPKKSIPSLAPGELTGMCACTRLICRAEENKPLLSRLDTVHSEEDVQTSATNTVLPQVRLQKLRPRVTSGLSHTTKPKGGLEVSRSCSASECDGQLLPLRPVPAEKPRKRPPQVPPLPLDLLPEILARKDAEEEALREEEGCPLGADSAERFDSSLTAEQQLSPCREADRGVENFALNLSLEELESSSERRCAQQPAPPDCCGLVLLQPQRLEAAYGKSSVLEEGIGASLNSAATHALDACAGVSQGEWWGDNGVLPQGSSTRSQPSPQLNIQANCKTFLLSTSGQEVSLSSSISSHLRRSSGAACRTLEEGTQTAAYSECVHRSNLQQSASHQATEIKAGVPQELERDGEDAARGAVQQLDQRMDRVHTTVFDTLDSPLEKKERTPQKPLDDHMPSGTPFTVQKWEESQHGTDFSINEWVGGGYEEQLEPSDLDLLVSPERKAQLENVPVKAGPRWASHRSVVDEISARTPQWTDSRYSGEVLPEEEVCPPASPVLQRKHGQTFSRTAPPQKEDAQHSLQPPSLDSSSHVRASKVASGDAGKHGRSQPCSSYEGTLPQASRQQQRPQRRTVNTQSQKERLPVQVREQQRFRTAFRHPLRSEKSPETGDRPRALLRQKQPEKTPLTLHAKRKEALVGTQASTKKGDGVQAPRCVRKAVGGSVSQKDEPSAVSNSGVDARQLYPQPCNKPRKLQLDLKRRQSKSIVEPSPARESNIPSGGQLFPPPEGRLLGVRQRRDHQRPPTQPVRPSAVRSPLSLHSTECRKEQRNEISHLSDVLLLELPLSDPMCDSIPELPVHTCPEYAHTTGDTSLNISTETHTSPVKPTSTCAQAQISKPSQASCRWPKVLEKHSSQTSGNFRGRSCGVPKVPFQTNSPHLSLMDDVARRTSLQSSDGRSTVSGGLRSSAADPAVDVRRQPWRRQAQPDRRPRIPANAGCLDALQQLATSSQTVQLQSIYPACVGGLAGRPRGEQIFPSWSTHNKKKMTAECCESCPAERHPPSENQFCLCVPGPSIVRSEDSGEQPMEYPAVSGRPDAMHSVRPFRTISSTVQPLPRRVVPMHSVAQVHPSPSVTGHPRKSVSGSLLYCPAGKCRPEARTLETDQLVSTTQTCGIKYQVNMQYWGTFSQAEASQLCSPSSHAYLRPSKAAECRGVPLQKEISLSDPAGTDPSQRNFPHKLCHFPPHAVSYPERTLHLPFPRRVLPDSRLNPPTVICTH